MDPAFPRPRFICMRMTKNRRACLAIQNEMAHEHTNDISIQGSTHLVGSGGGGAAGELVAFAVK